MRVNFLSNVYKLLQVATYCVYSNIGTVIKSRENTLYRKDLSLCLVK